MLKLKRMMERANPRVAAAFVVLVIGLGLIAAAQEQGETDPTDGAAAWRFEDLGDGVWFATGTGAMTTFSNSLVIVNDDHAMLVDTTVSPAAARKLVAEIATEVTDKPIRYVFNTHFHFDHSHGNQIFGDDVEIVGHDFVRLQHVSTGLDQRTNRAFAAAIPGQIEGLEAQIAAASDAAARTQLETALRQLRAHRNAIQETVVKAPNVTYSDTLTLVKGGREVQLHFPGRGHTGGDTLVFLPEERIVFTGDFFLGSPGANALPYMGDGFVNEWPASLDGLKALDFEIMVPGHGTPFRDRSQIDDLQAYLGDLWAQVSALRKEGLSPEEAAGRVDLSAHADAYGAQAGSADPRAVLRMYEILQVLHPM
ncbi:MAG: MBL fold metallo-hydrolase [Acidobacteria bacterium]|nr:MBL fold metallo-hydrolase [Acidobacteriota bacterium]